MKKIQKRWDDQSAELEAKFGKRCKRVECADGFSMSVPVQVVTNVLAKHGGMISGEVPDGVIPLTANDKRTKIHKNTKESQT